MVVDDSVVVRGLLARWLQQAGMAVAAACPNGSDAVARIASADPDIVLLDIMMPFMTGLDALPLLLKNRPGTQIIVVSSLATRDAELAMRCLAGGAVEFLAKPASNRHLTTSMEFREELIALVIAIHSRNLPFDAVQSAAAASPAFQLRAIQAPEPAGPPDLIAIGGSTGGPQAIAEFLSCIGPILPDVSVLIAQHMPATFTPVFARHLAAHCGREVREAVPGESLERGAILLGQGGRHLTVSRVSGVSRLMLSGPAESGHGRPSVDVLFESAAKAFGSKALGVVFSGMGADGAHGSVAIARKGGAVLAQDRESSTVWGMPAAALRTGACCFSGPAPALARRVRALFGDFA